MVQGLNKDEHLLIDGTPRRVIEAKILESVFDFLDRSNVNIIYLNVSREWAIQKMHDRGRNDDKKIDYYYLDKLIQKPFLSIQTT